MRFYVGECYTYHVRQSSEGVNIINKNNIHTGRAEIARVERGANTLLATVVYSYPDINPVAVIVSVRTPEGVNRLTSCKKIIGNGTGSPELLKAVGVLAHDIVAARFSAADVRGFINAARGALLRE